MTFQKVKLKKSLMACLCFLLALIITGSTFLINTASRVSAEEPTFSTKDTDIYHLQKTITPLANNIYKAEIEFNNKDAYDDMYVTLCIDVSTTTDIEGTKKIYSQLLEDFQKSGSKIRVALVFFGSHNITSKSVYEDSPYKSYLKQEDRSTIKNNSFAIQSKNIYEDGVTYSNTDNLPKKYPANYVYYTVGGSDHGYFDITNTHDADVISAMSEFFIKPVAGFGKSPYDVAWDRAYYREIQNIPKDAKKAIITIGDFQSTWVEANDNIEKKGAFNIARYIQSLQSDITMISIMTNGTGRKLLNEGSSTPRAWALAKLTTTDRPTKAQADAVATSEGCTVKYNPEVWQDSSSESGKKTPWTHEADDAIYKNFYYAETSDDFESIPDAIKTMLLKNASLKHYPTDHDVVIHETLNPNFEVIRSDENYPITCGFATSQASTAYYTAQYIKESQETNTNQTLYGLTTYSSSTQTATYKNKNTCVVYNDNGTDELTASIPFDKKVVGKAQNASYTSTFQNGYSTYPNPKYKLTYYFKLKDNAYVSDEQTVNTHILGTATADDGTNAIKSSQIMINSSVNTVILENKITGQTSDLLPGLAVKLEPKTFTIKFDSNGGSGEMDDMNPVYGKNEDNNLTANEFTKTMTAKLHGNGGTVEDSLEEVEYTPKANFRGWSTAAEDKTIAYADKGKFYTNTEETNIVNAPDTTATLYAQWQATITLPTPTRTNYTFDEWNTKEDGNGFSYDAGDTVTFQNDNMDYYALWIANKYTVKYDMNGGTEDTDTTFGTPQKAVLGDDLILYSGSPQKTDYDFAGWALEKKNTYTEDDIVYQPGDVFEAPSEEEVTLYAVWKGTTRLITSADTYEGVYFIDTDNETNEIDIVRYTGVVTPETYIKISDFPTPDTCHGYGYVFTGWGNKEGTNTLIGNLLPKNQTVYAQGEERELYEIAYDVNYGEDRALYVDGHEYVSDKIEDVPLALYFGDQLSKRDGYTFLGWSENSEDKTPTYTRETPYYMFNRSTTMYAIWEPAKYTITYDANGGINPPADQTKEHDTDIALHYAEGTEPTDMVSKLHYTFIGWSTDPDATEPMYRSGATYTENEDLELYAIWEKTKYTVTYDYATNGGSYVDVESKEFIPDEDVFDNTPIAVKEGWEFIGWAEHTNSTDILDEKFELPEEGDLTVFAVYKKELTAYFSDHSSYDPKTETDTPFEEHSVVYNNQERASIDIPYERFAGDKSDNIDSYIEGKLLHDSSATYQFINREDELIPDNMVKDKVYVLADEPSPYYDMVYETYPYIYYFTDDDNEFANNSMEFLKTFGITNKLYNAEGSEASVTVSGSVPEKEGYTFAGWTGNELTSEKERILPGDTITIPNNSPLIMGDHAAYAQWLTASIYPSVEDKATPGSFITYTVSAETTGDGKKLIIKANIPEGTEFFASSEDNYDITSEEGYIIFTEENFGAGDEITKTFTVKINDDVNYGDIIKAQATAVLEVTDSTTDTEKHIEHETEEVTTEVKTSYDVSYYAGEGSGTVPETETFKGDGSESTTVKNAEDLSKPNSAFLCWRDIKTGEIYDVGQPLDVTRNIDMEAVWAEINVISETSTPYPDGEIQYIVTADLPRNVDNIYISQQFDPSITIKDVRVEPANDEDINDAEYEDPEADDTNVTVLFNKVNDTEKYNIIYTYTINEDAVPGDTLTTISTLVRYDFYTFTGSLLAKKTDDVLYNRVVYLTGDDYTTSYCSDGETLMYSGDDVYNVSYYKKDFKVDVQSYDGDKKDNFVLWKTGDDFYKEAEELTVEKNEVFNAVYFEVKQEVQDEQDDYIVDENYVSLISFTAPYTGQITLVIEGKEGSDVIDVLDITDKEIDSENNTITITLDVEEGTEYGIKAKAQVNSDVEAGDETGLKVTAIAASKEFNANDDDVLIGEFFTVTYDINGADGDIPLDSHRYRPGDKAVIASDEGFAYDGYVFSGWSTLKDAKGVIYNVDDEIETNEDITLYAFWTVAAALPETGAPTVAIIAAISTMALLAVGIYITLKKKSCIAA